MTTDSQAPVLTNPGNQTIDELATLTLPLTATDPNAGDTLTFSLVGTATPGLSINATSGQLTFTPTEAQGPNNINITVRVADDEGLTDEEGFTITVNEVNQGPVLAAIADRTANIGDTVTLTATATDADLPAQLLTFSLETGAPSGATIDAQTGAFSWTIPDTQSTGDATIGIRVTDSKGGSDVKTFTVSVTQPNRAPVLTNPGNRTIDELTTLDLALSATDPDAGDVLTFSLVVTATPGLSINATTGQLTFTPTEVQGPSAINVTVRVADDDGLTDDESFSITVNEVNQAPVLTVIADRNANLGDTVSFTAAATDADLPAQTLTFSLESGAPSGATINAQTGEFSWTIPDNQTIGPVTIGVRVTDSLGEFDIEEFVVNVVSTPAAFASIISVAPQNGEQDVRLDRPLRVTFDRQIDPLTVTSDVFYAMSVGEKITGTIRVGSDLKSIAIYPDEMFSFSTTGQIFVNGDLIKDADGNAIDADGDGVAGGIGKFRFSTVGLTRLAGTAIHGYIFDSTRSTPENKVPIVGVTLRVEGIPELTAVTDENGFFRLQDTPGSEFYVSFDMSTVTSAPEGFKYLAPTKPFHPVPGMDVPLGKADGRMFDMYFPLVDVAQAIPVTQGVATMVKLGEAALDHLETIKPGVPRSEWEKLAVEIPADSLFFEDGTSANEVQIFALDPTRVPAPLPVGVDSSIVFSIDAGGASDFGTPAKLTFPNLDGLAPGEVRPIYTFDHDAGEWKITGRAVVSEDGAVLVTDEGGVTTLGWKTVGREPNSRLTAQPVSLTSQKPTRQLEQAIEAKRNAEQSQLASVPNESIEKASKQVLSLVDFLKNGVIDGQSLLDQFKANTALAIWFRDFIPAVGNAIGLLGRTATAFTGVSKFETVTNVIEETLKKSNSLEGEFKRRALSFIENPFFKSLASKSVSGLKQLGQWVSDQIEGDTNESVQQPQILSGFSINGQESLVGLNTRLKKTVPASEPLIASIESRLTLIRQAAEQSNDQSVLSMSAYDNLLQDFERFGNDLAQLIEIDDLSELASHADEVISSFVANMTIDSSNDSDNLFVLVQFGESTVRRFRGLPGGKFTTDLQSMDGGTLNILVYNASKNTGGLIVQGVGAGQTEIDISQLVLLDLSISSDNDADGLSEFAEFVVGTSDSGEDTDLDGVPDGVDTDGDGISDFAEIQQGFNPLDGIAYPSGIIGNVLPKGEVKDVAVTGDLNNAAQQTAYLATGSYGLAIADVSKFQRPSLLGQIELPGIATAVSVDAEHQIAYVAAGGAGLHYVDVSDPFDPKLIRTITSFGNVAEVELVDGVVAIAGSRLALLDLVTGETLENIEIPTQNGSITDMVLSGDTLFVISGNSRLHSIAFGDGSNIELSSIEIPTPPVRRETPDNMRLFVANGVAYISNGLEVEFISQSRPLERGGYVTFDVSDPSNMSLISNIDTGDFQAGNLQTVLNGSGLAIVAGGFRGLQVHDASDPANTYNLLAEFATPGSAEAVAVVGGIAFLADGAAGLQVINYRDFDAKPPPTVSIDVDALDKDPATPGIQVEEGTRVRIMPTITDDVQVRTAELLVNGVVVQNDLTFPYDLTLIVPNLATGTTSIEIQVRATDTGGNSSISNPITLEIIPDITPPELRSVSPGNVALTGLQSISLTFSEGIDTTLITPGLLSLVSTANPQTSVDIDSVDFRRDDRTVQFRLTEPLPEGEYEFQFDLSNFKDRAGNAAASSIETRTFKVVEATAVWKNPNGGFWDDVNNWENGELPGPDDAVLIVLNPGAQVIYRGVGGGFGGSRGAQVARLTVEGRFVMQSGTLEAGVIKGDGAEIVLDGGTLKNTVIEESVPEMSLSSVTLDNVTLNTDAIIDAGTGSRFITVENGLTVNGTLTLAGSNHTASLGFANTQSLAGTGSIVFSTQNQINEQANNDLSVYSTMSNQPALLTIEESLTLVGQRGRISGNPSNSAIRLLGLLLITDAGSFMISQLENQGDIRVENGQLRSTTDLTSSGLIFISNLGEVSVDGNLTLLPESILSIVLSRTQPDYLQVRDELQLDGTLELTHALNFVPNIDEIISIISFASLAGNFSQTASPEGFTYSVGTDPNSIFVQAENVPANTSTRIAGQVVDANGKPMQDVKVQLGSFATTTATDGSFMLELPQTVAPPEPFHIEVPLGDPMFDPFNTGNQVIEFRRAAYDQTTGTEAGNPRQHPNNVSAFLDGSVVYGSDDERAAALRTFNGGLLKVSEGDLLPLDDSIHFPEGPVANDNSGPLPPELLFVAGDRRANDNVNLMALHTLFVREHNRKASEFAASNPSLDDEQLYQESRRWLIALLQSVTYNEFLPILLGDLSLPAYEGYDPSIDPQISAAFSTAAFRIGHTLASDELLRTDENGQSLEGGPLTLLDAFFNPLPIVEDGIDPYLLGMIFQQTQELDAKIVGTMRNFLFGPPGAGGLDLISLNIQRGRDLGLPSYNQARRDFGLDPVATFSDISSSESVQQELASVYADVEEVDLIVGGLAEDHATGAVVGELFQAIIRDQFLRTRNGDRFWFENGQFTEPELNEIRSTTLANIIQRNTEIDTTPPHVFTTGFAPTSTYGSSSSDGEVLEVRAFDGSGNNISDPLLGKAGENLLSNFTLDYGNGISAPAGEGRPGAREISNAVFAQNASMLNRDGLTTMFMIWGQFIVHDLSLTPGGETRTLIFAVETLGQRTTVTAELSIMLGRQLLRGMQNIIPSHIVIPT